MLSTAFHCGNPAAGAPNAAHGPGRRRVLPRLLLLLVVAAGLLTHGAHGRKSEFARKDIDFRKLEEDYGVDEPPPPPIWGHSQHIDDQLSYAFLDAVCSDENCAQAIDRDWGHLLRSGGLECHHGIDNSDFNQIT